EAQPVEGTTVIWVAGAGIVLNAATALLFMRGRTRDINIASVFTHMAGMPHFRWVLLSPRF
ncbi:MAG TPA: hypothetical protein VMV19_16870, partial [Xanthobacteraceae bacterium]|nr:hypothetical protein [Xanthobacteraceae bacterium]